MSTFLPSLFVVLLLASVKIFTKVPVYTPLSRYFSKCGHNWIQPLA